MTTSDAAVTLDHTGFTLRLSSIKGSTFLPKYYDPEIAARLAKLKQTHNLITIGDLIANGHLSVATGDEIGKMAYGTGTIPFVRTSDIANWELKTDAKHGISSEIYSEYAAKQDVRANDIMFVRDGTYLIGQIALVTASDLPLLYQSHVLKFRISEGSPLSPMMFLAALSTPIVRRQVRSKKFTADIIDTIGDRFRELTLPIPKSDEEVGHIVDEVLALTTERSRLRDKIRKIPFWVQGIIEQLTDEVPTDAITPTAESGNVGFLLKLSQLKQPVFIPRYYDPTLKEDLRSLSKTHTLITLQDLVSQGVLSWETGIEVGKMAYGTGRVPFVRTSDLSNWELKGDPKQAVSDEIYLANKQDVRSQDILVVRDGTYLVGTSCILTKADERMLFCGGLYKLRVEQPEALDPYLLLAILNSPIVRRQMRSKQFTRDIIDTLGKRIFEVVLPIPKDAQLRKLVATATKEVIVTRATLRDRTKEIALETEGVPESELFDALELLEEVAAPTDEAEDEGEE